VRKLDLRADFSRSQGGMSQAKEGRRFQKQLVKIADRRGNPIFSHVVSSASNPTWFKLRVFLWLLTRLHRRNYTKKLQKLV
jgi:hypothetical protein